MQVAIIGTGNIGTDLMWKVLRSSDLELVAMVGIDPESEGLRIARERGVETSVDGIEWVMANHESIDTVFEATSASIHAQHSKIYREAGITAIDLTPAAVGPFVVPSANLTDHISEPNLNLVTCGGQATVPIVHAAQEIGEVPYAEIVSTVASRSAGPGTRKNIDEFTKTTARALEQVGGAGVGKAIIILNPAEPPILMRNTVYCAVPEKAAAEPMREAIKHRVEDVAQRVPGYRTTSEPVFEEGPFITPAGQVAGRVVTLLEVEGAGDFLEKYAGNLDIMTAAAVWVGEEIARHRAYGGQERKPRLPSASSGAP